MEICKQVRHTVCEVSGKQHWNGIITKIYCCCCRCRRRRHCYILHIMAFTL